MKSLIRVPSCYKNSPNLACIDLMLTNSNQSFENYCTVETGLSDFCKVCFENLLPEKGSKSY